MPKAYEHLKVSKEQCVANWSKLHNALNKIWKRPVVDKSGFSVDMSNICMNPKCEGRPYKYMKYQHLVDCKDKDLFKVFNTITKTFPKAKVWTDEFEDRIYIKYLEDK